jgi:hypothetical protein
VWCALSSTGIFEPVLTENTSLLQNVFELSFVSYIADKNKAWFQQDGTRLHMADIMLDFSMDTFRNRTLWNRYPHVHVISVTRLKAM